MKECIGFFFIYHLGPLQTLDVSLEVNQKLSVPCYLSSTSDNKTVNKVMNIKFIYKIEIVKYHSN